MFKFRAGKKILRLHLIAHKLNKRGFLGRFIADRVKRKIIYNFSCYFSPKADIANSVKFPHPTGIVIGEGVTIGEKTIIYQNVTFGAAKIGGAKQGDYPKIGNRVTIYAGAVIIGNISIGDDAIVGANAVVNKDVEGGQTVVGIPARPIQNRI